MTLARNRSPGGVAILIIPSINYNYSLLGLRLCRLYHLILRISKVLATRNNKSSKIPVSSK